MHTKPVSQKSQEVEIFRQLKQGRDWLNSPEKYAKELVSLLNEKGINTTNTYIIKSIPDQAEELFTLILPNEKIALVEISRIGKAPVWEEINKNDYMKKCSQRIQTKILLANKLQRNE